MSALKRIIQMQEEDPKSFYCNFTVRLPEKRRRYNENDETTKYLYGVSCNSCKWSMKWRKVDMIKTPGQYLRAHVQQFHPDILKHLTARNLKLKSSEDDESGDEKMEEDDPDYEDEDEDENDEEDTIITKGFIQKFFDLPIIIGKKKRKRENAEEEVKKFENPILQIASEYDTEKRGIYLTDMKYECFTMVYAISLVKTLPIGSFIRLVEFHQINQLGRKRPPLICHPPEPGAPRRPIQQYGKSKCLMVKRFEPLWMPHLSQLPDEKLVANPIVNIDENGHDYNGYDGDHEAAGSSKNSTASNGGRRQPTMAENLGKYRRIVQEAIRNMIERQTNSDMAGIGLYEIIGYLFAHKSDDLGQPTPKEIVSHVLMALHAGVQMGEIIQQYCSSSSSTEDSLSFIYDQKYRLFSNSITITSTSTAPAALAITDTGTDQNNRILANEMASTSAATVAKSTATTSTSFAAMVTASTASAPIPLSTLLSIVSSSSNFRPIRANNLPIPSTKSKNTTTTKPTAAATKFIPIATTTTQTTTKPTPTTSVSTPESTTPTAAADTTVKVEPKNEMEDECFTASKTNDLLPKLTKKSGRTRTFK